MRPPFEGTTDRREGGPTSDEQTGGWHFPVEARGDVQDGEGFVVGQRGDAGEAIYGGEALVEVGAARHAIGDVVLLAINEKPIAEVKDGAALVPPCAAATNPIWGVDADGSLLSEEV